jgi:hypothetical protein
MTQTFQWGSVGTVIHIIASTELNSLANGTISALSAEINNSGGSIQGLLTLNLGSAAFVAPSYINFYLMPSSDLAGGSYGTLGTAAQTALSNYLWATIYIKGTTAAQLEMYFPVVIPPGKSKVFAITGGSCPTLASSGNTLDFYPTPVTAV